MRHKGDLPARGREAAWVGALSTASLPPSRALLRFWVKVGKPGRGEVRRAQDGQYRHNSTCTMKGTLVCNLLQGAKW